MRSRLILFVVFILMLSQVLPAAAQTADCGKTAIFIHDIQGNGATSPQVNATVTIEGVVVGDYQRTDNELSGFYVQEEADQADSDDATSEGIFVFDNNLGVDVAVGNVVRVAGTVKEFSSSGSSLTEIAPTKVVVCPGNVTIAPTAIHFPVASGDIWEQYEAMLVSFSQTLTVTENFELGRFGRVLLSADGRLFQPTNVVAPGTAANQLLATYTTRSIILDDANTKQNRDPILYPTPGGLSAANTLRDGYTVAGLVGVVDHRNGDYVIQPVGTVNFAATNPRPTTAPTVDGNLKVLAMNVLNYFNGDGSGGGFPTERGANTAAEFTRQRDKIINVIAALDADVVGMMEMENDEGAKSAIADLVDGINAKVGAGTYAFVDTGKLGTDAIRVALIYKPATVAVLDWATNTDPVFSRPPLAVTLREISSGEFFTVAVNHFKSKGSCPSGSSDPNADKGDGQSCWNALRVSQAQALTLWLDSDPTGSGDPDRLIVGDLNAYAMEDPIRSIQNDGYTNLIQEFVGDEAYSFMFDGQAGYLDHALASSSIVPQVGGAAEWHINADEPLSLDYNTEFKSTGQVTSLYSDLPFRASDHDPLIVGLNLGGGTTATTVPAVTPTSRASNTPRPTNVASRTPTPRPTNTPRATTTPPTNTPTPALTRTMLPTITPSAAPPTNTVTPVPPTNTSSPVPPTRTPIPPSSTPVPPTRTPVPPTNTVTPVPPTNTSSPVPATATNTLVPPSSTPVPTNTQVPATNTAIPAPTSTRTPLPPTNTLTPIPPSSTPLVSATPVPTVQPTPVPPSDSSGDTIGFFGVILLLAAALAAILGVNLRRRG